MPRAASRRSAAPGSSSRPSPGRSPTRFARSPPTATYAPGSPPPPASASPPTSAPSSCGGGRRMPTGGRSARAGRSRRLPTTGPEQPLDGDRRRVGDERTDDAGGAPEAAPAAHRPQPDRDRLAGLAALGAGGDVRGPHHPGREHLVEHDHPVALRDAQPEVVLGGERIAGVIAAEAAYHVAAEGGGAVRDRVEAHQHRPHV